LIDGTSGLVMIGPGVSVAVEDVIAEGDKVVARNTVTGTHQGEYTGSRV